MKDQFCAIGRLLLQLLGQQWATPLSLLPFILMYALHRQLGLSDAMLAAPSPGEIHWPLYNLAMFLVFVAGINAYLVHTAFFAMQNWPIAVLKLLLLAVGWSGLLLFGF